jgi:hypothetical protein
MSHSLDESLDIEGDDLQIADADLEAELKALSSDSNIMQVSG